VNVILVEGWDGAWMEQVEGWMDRWIDGIDGYSGVLCCVCVCVVGGVALPEGTCGRKRERRPGGGGRGEPEGAVVGRANNTRKKYNPSIIHPLKLKSEGKGGKGENIVGVVVE